MRLGSATPAPAPRNPVSNEDLPPDAPDDDLLPLLPAERPHDPDGNGHVVAPTGLLDVPDALFREFPPGHVDIFPDGGRAVKEESYDISYDSFQRII